MRLTIRPERWEHGSDLTLATGALRAPDPWWGDKATLASGRDALAWVLRHGAEHHGWRRVWLPEYYCHVVPERLQGEPLAVMTYRAGPDGGVDTPHALPGDVLVRVSYFGWGMPPLPTPFDGPVVEDHTHDPWAASASKADVCVASLRKTLPLPDGGIAWRPDGVRLPLPPPPSEELSAIAASRLAAMALKRLYLLGESVEKEMFRSLAVSAEHRLGAGPLSGMSDWSKALLPTLPAAAWRRQRAANTAVLASALSGVPGVEVLDAPSGWDAPGVPLGLLLRCASAEQRGLLHAALCQQRIYPAVLWPLMPRSDGRPADAGLAAFSATTLLLHTDARYGEDDLVRVAQAVRNAAAACA